jgi:hypothetical protein
MRVFCVTAAVVVCALIGYASSGTSAQTRWNQAGITLDETVMLYFDLDKPGRSCTVGDMQGHFVLCKDVTKNAVGGRTRLESWYTFGSLL